ncbi:transposase, IS4 family [Ancylostoma ceylanicum]|uniref:Transposase, IS4 family n=1 Tax=Ancylostoma ceylanicum TaxID=53326 RepID=A0A0D6LHL4_9BILA|nr:transposase, IS4 family [Ancylostoma ceylanicum]
MEKLDRSFDRILLESDEEYEETDETTEVDTELLHQDDSDLSLSDNDEDEPNPSSWSSEIKRPSRWAFSEQNAGINFAMLMDCKSPVDYCNLFVDDEVIDLIVNETNRYGATKDEAFVPTNNLEMKQFLGIIIQMGFVRLPKLEDYWSTSAEIGGNAICGSIMPRKRFYSLMKSLHLVDNGKNNTSKTYKIDDFMKLFISNCQRLLIPGKDVCIDESLIPFRGRLKFRQYIPSKKHKYGIKVFKVCSQHGYTYDMKIYAGKEDQPRAGSVAEDVVLKLMENLLGKGRTLYTDNWYTSLPLARSLLRNQTNLVGTCRKNRTGLPKDVTVAKLKKHEHVAAQSGDGILVMKWRDKRDVMMLSTVHDDAIAENGKPQVVLDYNKSKTFIDLSDQMASYCPYARKTTKWYLRMFFHIITQTAVVNAWHLFQEHSQTKMKIVDFKRRIVASILNLKRPSTPKSRHRLVEDDENGKKRWRRCILCYNRLSSEHGSQVARKRAAQVKTICSKCNKPYCLDCFGKFHISCK